MLKKELTLYERDAEGELIPQERKLEVAKEDAKKYPELVEETIKVIPLKRGELKVMFGLKGKSDDKKPETDKDEDAEIVMKYCKDPVYTMEELSFAKPVVVRSIVRTIFIESGIKLDENAGTRKIDDEDDFGKN